MKHIFTAGLLRFSAISLLVIIVSCSNFSPDPCPGAQECGDGTCAPTNNVCCNNGTSCPHGTVCENAANACVDERVAACLSVGEKPCYNFDGVIDCAPPLSNCCGQHNYCPFGHACLGNNLCQ